VAVQAHEAHPEGALPLLRRLNHVQRRRHGGTDGESMVQSAASLGCDPPLSALTLSGFGTDHRASCAEHRSQINSWQCPYFRLTAFKLSNRPQGLLGR
jgi:hypothetical protein